VKVPPRRRLDSLGTAARLVAVLLFLAAGIGSSRAGAVPADAEGRETPLSIHVWRYDFAGEGAFLADLQGAYQRQTGRTVELYQGEWRECSRKVEEWTGRGIRYAPDMIIVQDADLPLVLGHAASLEGRFPERFLDSFYPGVLAQGRVQGVLTGLPWMVRPVALYYNADVLQAKGVTPPRTPEELLSAAQELADPPQVYGFGVPGNPSGGAAECCLTLFRAFGGVLFDQRGRLSIDSDPGRQTLEFFSALSTTHGTQPEVLTWSESEVAQLFLSGRVAMVIDQPWLLREVSYRPPPFKVGIAPVPRTEGGTEHLSTDCVIIFDTARDMDACVHFLQYALGRDCQRALAGLGVPSVRKDGAAGLPEGEGWEVYRRALRDGRGPSAATWAQIAPVLTRTLYGVLSGRATPQEALDAIDIDLVDDPEYVRLGLPPPKTQGDN